MKFLPIRADIERNLFENAEYLPFVAELLFKNKNLLTDDYYPEDDGRLLDFLIDRINAAYPWFVVGVAGNVPVGAAWFTHWHAGSGNKYHSCQLHACIDKKFWGIPSLYAIEELLKFVVFHTGVKRVQTEIPEFNKTAIAYVKRAGFRKEGVLRCSTVKDGKPLSHVLLSRVFV